MNVNANTSVNLTLSLLDKSAKGYYFEIKELCQDVSKPSTFDIDKLKNLQPVSEEDRCYKELATICYEYYLIITACGECGQEILSNLKNRTTKISTTFSEETKFIESKLSEIIECPIPMLMQQFASKNNLSRMKNVTLSIIAYIDSKPFIGIEIYQYPLFTQDEIVLFWKTLQSRSAKIPGTVTIPLLFIAKINTVFSRYAAIPLTMKAGPKALEQQIEGFSDLQ